MPCICTPPLRYQISSWEQLPQCMSNNSLDLSLHVTKLIQDSRLSGTLISVEHSEYGTLFSYIVDASGTMISSGIESLNTEDILIELSRFGFYIQFSEDVYISDTQLKLIRSAYELGFDKLRVLNVWHYENGSKVFSPYTIAFHSKFNQDWLNNWYSASDKEFMDALVKGQVINLDSLTEVKGLNWSWLYGYVMNIEDVLLTRKPKLYAIDRKSIPEDI